MGRGVVVWATAAAMACGGTDGAGTDGGSAVSDGGGRDGGGDCLPPVAPEPLACAQTQPWIGYWRDVSSSGGEQVALVAMGDQPGLPEVASGDERPRADSWSFSPDAGWVAFRAWYTPGPSQLYAAPLTSGGPGELRAVSGPFKVDGNVAWYGWSPDGRKIAYVADQEHEAGELWVLDLDSDGYAQRVNPPLSFLGNVGTVAWSPDGTRLLYSAFHDNPAEMDLYLVDVSGSAPSEPVRLTGDLDGDVEQLMWTPDGRGVVFAIDPGLGGAMYVAWIECRAVDGPHLLSDAWSSGRFSEDGQQIYFLGRTDEGQAVFRSDLSVVPPVTEVISEPAPSPVEGEPAWSSTGIRVAFRTYSGRLEMLDGVSGERSIVNGPLVDDGGVFAFAWSPDGNSIAYAANQLEYFTIDLFHVDLSGDAPARRRRVTPTVDHDFSVGSIAWSPDSSRLAYRANQEAQARVELFLAERQDGIVGPPAKVNDDLTLDNASVHDDVRFSPDGTHVLYTADDREAQPNGLFVAPIDGSGDPILLDGPDVGAAEWTPCPAP